MFIVSFHLFPEAFYIGGVLNVILGVTIGILVIIILETLLDKLSCCEYKDRCNFGIKCGYT